MTKPTKGIIEDWTIISNKKPMSMQSRLDYSHKHYMIIGILNGRPMMTSEIVKIKDNYVETLNSIYYLAEPLVSYDETLEMYRKKNTESDYDLVIERIAKMIATGKLNKCAYDEYLADTSIGFVSEDDLYKYLKKEND